MIENFEKLSGLEFNFPIMSADKVMFRIASVSTVTDDSDIWHGVLGCKRIDTESYLGIPDYVVFTIDAERGGYRINCMMNNEKDRNDFFLKSMFLTPSMFLQCLTEMSKLY